MSQNNVIFRLIIMFGLLVSCQSSQQLSEDSQSGTLSELPPTWTPEINLTPLPSPTLNAGNEPLESPSPTPNFIPPTPTKPISSYPTQTPLSYYELPQLIAGKEITLNNINMFNSEEGWATGNQETGHQRVLFTEDGGYTWQDRTPFVLVPEGYLSRMDNIIAHFFDETTALVLIGDTQDELDAGNYFVWKTEDSGLSWSRSTPLPFPVGWYFIFPGGFSFINSETGWLLIQTEFSHMHDFSYLFATRDGGLTWKLVNQPGNGMIEVLKNTGLAFGNDKIGWVTKDELGFDFGPFLEVTKDGGITWEKIYLPHPSGGEWQDTLQSCQTISPIFTSPQTGYMLVQCFIYNVTKSRFIMENPNTYIYATSDWGESWQINELPSPANQLLFLDIQNGYAMGKDHYRTVNGGADWTLIKSAAWEGQFSFINPDEGWAIARRGEDIALVHTIDGGLTYHEIKPTIKP